MYYIFLKFIFIYLFAQLASFKLGNAFLGSGYIYRALFLFLQQTTKPHLIWLAIGFATSAKFQVKIKMFDTKWYLAQSGK